jgi:hypothetical protein
VCVCVCVCARARACILCVLCDCVGADVLSCTYISGVRGQGPLKVATQRRAHGCQAGCGCGCVFVCVCIYTSELLRCERAKQSLYNHQNLHRGYSSIWRGVEKCSFQTEPLVLLHTRCCVPLYWPHTPVVDSEFHLRRACWKWEKNLGVKVCHCSCLGRHPCHNDAGVVGRSVRRQPRPRLTPVWRHKPGFAKALRVARRSSAFLRLHPLRCVCRCIPCLCESGAVARYPRGTRREPRVCFLSAAAEL